MTFTVSPLLIRANITVTDVRLLGGMLSAVRQMPPNANPSSAMRQDKARLDGLCNRLMNSGFVDHVMLFETSDTPALVDMALTATLGLFVSLPGEVGAAAVAALGHGVGALGAARKDASSGACMSLDRIRMLIQNPEAAAQAAEAVRSGRVFKRPVFAVAPPGSGFGDWFGKQMYSADAKNVAKYPAKALEEWGRYVDALSQHAEVFVIPYASDRDSSIWRIVYTANGPQFLEIENEIYAVLPNLSHLGRQGEHRWFQSYALELGVHPDRIVQSPVFQEGQADFSRPIPRKGRKPLVFLGYGIRTPTAQPYEDMRHVVIGQKGKGRVVDLLQNYDVETIRMNPNSHAFHQDTWLNLIRNRKGELYCMYCPTWIHPDDRERFAAVIKANKIPAVVLSDVDAMAYAANANEVNGKIFLVKGGPFEVSAELRKALKKAGFALLELEFDELFSKAGGGTRCMVNEIRDIDRAKHSEFFARMEFFRYVSGSWERLKDAYPAQYDPKEVSRRKAFVR